MHGRQIHTIPLNVLPGTDRGGETGDSTHRHTALRVGEFEVIKCGGFWVAIGDLQTAVLILEEFAHYNMTHHMIS